MATSKRRRTETNGAARRGWRDEQFTSIDGLLSSASSSSTSDIELDESKSGARVDYAALPYHRQSSQNTPLPSRPTSSFSPVADSPRPMRPRQHRRRSSLPATYIHIHTSAPPSPHQQPRRSLAQPPSQPPLTPNPLSLVNVPIQISNIATVAPTSTTQKPKRPSLGPQTLTWTSNETRRLEYAAIDRAHSGMRGFLRRLLPQSCFSDGYRRFWSVEGSSGGEGKGDEDDDSDTRSVRRYRLRLDEEDDGEMLNEKRREVVGSKVLESDVERRPRMRMRLWT